MNSNRGFTLIELLVVIGILSILLSVTLVAVNPARQFGLANDTKRRSDVNAILNAIGQYSSDEKGGLPGDNPDPTQSQITTTPKEISTAGANICGFLVTKYIAALPGDPTIGIGVPVSKCELGYNTKYTVVRNEDNNRVTVSAPAGNTYSKVEISATR